MTKPTPPDAFCRLVETRTGARCVREHRFHPTRRWRFDYALPEHRLAIEVEGGVWTAGRHIRAQGFLGDMEKYNTAAVLGWRLIRVTPDTLISRHTLELIRRAISVTTTDGCNSCNSHNPQTT